MPRYSVAEAKNNLPRLIDKAIEGEDVTITRHGRPVAVLRPSGSEKKPVKEMTEWLRRQRETLPNVGITSVELLRQVYEDYPY